MRRSLPVVVPALLLCGSVLAGCSEGSSSAAVDEGSSPSSPTASTPASASPSEEGSEAPAGSFEAVPGLRTEPTDTSQLRGFTAAEIWAGASVQALDGVTSGSISDEEGVVSTVTLGSTSAALASEDARAAATYWIESSPLSQGEGKLLDPVEVDGRTMEHVRVEGGGALEYEAFFHADGSYDVAVIFTIPRSVPDERRDELVASVMSTVELQ